MRRTFCSPGWMALVLGLISGLTTAIGQAPEPPSAVKVELRDGRTVSGTLEGSEPSGFFVRVESGPPVPLEAVVAISFDAPPIDPALGAPPFHARLGPSGQISGRLDGLDHDELRLLVDAGSKPLKIRRAGVKALVQRPGEAQVMRDGFETLDTGRWSMRVGDPSVDAETALVGERSLLLPSGGSAITARLADPIGAGRLEVAYLDGGRVVEDQRWFVDLTFHTKDGDVVTLRAVPGWTDETVAVESVRGGPALAIQRLLRRDGWHRLSVRFGADSIKLDIDGNELAYSTKGPDGVLVEIRLATESLGNARPDSDLSVRLDDLSLVRFGEPSGRLEVEPSADEIRFSTADQLFGRVPSAGPEHLDILLDPEGPAHEIPWSKVAGLYLRREPAQSRLIEGQIVRLEWRSGPGDDASDLDSAEGALKSVSDGQLTIDVPFVGAMKVPQARVTRLEPVSRVRRLVIDPSAHHLGDDPRTEPFFDPPQPEDAPLEIPFTLESVPPTPARLALDVVDVLGVSGDPQFSEDVRAGKYRTHLKINGQAIDDLNTAVHMHNVTPARVSVPIPPNLLKKGRNLLRIDQDFGSEERDNLELLGVAVEWPIESSSRANQP